MLHLLLINTKSILIYFLDQELNKDPRTLYRVILPSCQIDPEKKNTGNDY